MRKHLITALAVCAPVVLEARQTEVRYLSGTGLGDTVKWGFYCSDGNRSGQWDSIAVPSQWELEGYGEYTYGRWYTISKETQPSKETGTYRTAFTIPEIDRGNVIRIVFEGSMTDTEVFINGVSAGPMHQGAFYRFGYDISDKVKYGAENQLEVKVAKHSANNSVNAAERKADWWLFGGIYRPVYLEVRPATHIERIAVDCRADGSAHNQVFTSELPAGCKLEASIKPLTGKGKEQKQSVALQEGKEHEITHQWKDIRPWTPETPQLYVYTLTLKDAKNKVLHTHSERVGFRTVDFRPQDGIYVNGTKIVMKGINRHSFHPDGGRTTNKEISIGDLKLMKEMNMNAVRFHYPPDRHFLEVCDSMGMFVLDELCGWQNGYDSTLAPKLLTEMMTRDVNHPSIVIWNNGNEGGWSCSVDQLFYELDPQKRHVTHPWADYDQLDTHHYPAFQTGIARFTNGYKVFMPTEFMHGMYDQGHGAGLEDFWDSYTAHPLFAGGFMWDFCDNAVRRSDKNGILDSDGSNAPDGILGPYREKEGSYYTVRDIWAPIQFKKLYITPSFNGDFHITNHYLYTNLRECRMEYRLLRTPSPLLKQEPGILATGNITLPQFDPQESGKLHVDLPAGFREADVLEITAYHPDGTSMCTWSWPIEYAAGYFARQYKPAQQPVMAAIEQHDSLYTLSANGVKVSFDGRNGQICNVVNNGKTVSFGNGPIAVGVATRFKECAVRQEGAEAVLVARYLGAVDSIEWRMQPDGMLKMSAVMLNRASGGKGFDDSLILENISNFGLTFSYPEEKVEGIRWLGKGPYRVWKNRQRGLNYQVWQKDYNNTITGESFENLIYPEFKGYHANTYWLTLQTKEQPFTVYSESDGLFTRIYTPEEPHNRLSPQKTMPDFPEGDISFLYEIPGIRCFKPLHQHGPKSQPGMVRIKSGDEGIWMNLWFDFR